MGYVLLWIEDLAFWLLAIAWAVAAAVRLRRRWTGGLLIAAVLGLALVFWGLVSAMLGLMHYQGRVFTGLFFPVLALTILIFLGGLVLIVRGLLRDRDKRVRAASWSPAALGLAALAALLVHGMTFWNLDLAVRQQMDAMRIEAGTLALSVAPPHVADRENAAFLYQQAFEAGIVDKKPEAYNDWIEATSDSSSAFDPEDPEFVAYMQREAPLLRIVRQAAVMPVCSFNRDWGRPSLDMVINETQNMRAAARDLQLEIHLQTKRGEVRGAMQNVLAMHQMAEHVSQEPLLVSLLVSFALDSMAVGNLEHLLQTCPVTEEDLAVLDAWRPTPASPRVQRAMRMEEAFGLATFNQVAEWRDMDHLGLLIGTGGGWGPNIGPVYRVFLLTDDLRNYRVVMNRMQRTAVLPYTERQKALTEIEESLKSTPMGIVSGLLLPAVRAVEVAAARNDASQRLAHLAIAAHRYRLEHGEFPATIDELAAEGDVATTRDPFGEAPLRMVHRNGQIILYSLGQNLKDDGGMAAETAGGTDGDLIFTLAVPPADESQPPANQPSGANAPSSPPCG